MRTKAQKWGNSLAVRIPKAIAIESNIRQGTEVNLALEQGRIVLVPVAKAAYTLEELLAQVNKHNLHGEVDSGPPRGREVW